MNKFKVGDVIQITSDNPYKGVELSLNKDYIIVSISKHIVQVRNDYGHPWNTSVDQIKLSNLTYEIY